MRQITKEAVENFYKKKNWFKINTEIKVIDEDVFLILHNNRIAHLFENGDLYITTSGWNTKTTFERLKGLVNISISYRKGVLLLNGENWDGKWIKIN